MSGSGGSGWHRPSGQPVWAAPQQPATQPTGTQSETGQRPPKHPRSTRFAIVFVAVAAVLALLFYGVDTVVHHRVESGVAAELQTQLGTPDPPTVEIVGRPFLTQIAFRKIGEVHVSADDVGDTNGDTLPIQHVDMTLRDITTTDWWKTMNAAQVDGTALVSFDALKAATGTPFVYSGNGRFTVENNTNLYGVTVSAKVSGRLALDVPDQTVGLADPTVTVAGYTLPDIVARNLIDAIVKPIPLDGVPFGLQVTSLDAQDDGLHTGLSGQDVEISR